MEGAGVRLRRGFGYGEVPQFDPFLMFDDFTNDDANAYTAGFPWHPHRGIETVTYLLKGEVRHKDSLGNEGSIGAGGVQWMSAGHGIIHEEMPVVRPEGIQGFQLWVNLPHAEKMSHPKYQDIHPEDIPEVVESGAKVKVIAGSYKETKGPVSDIAVGPTYLDVTLDANMVFTYELPENDTLFIYVIDGDVVVKNNGNEQWVRVGEVGLTSHGDTFEMRAGTNGARLLLCSGTPIGESVAWGGPIVMNTEEELQEAFAEIQDGTFTEE